MSAQEIAMMSVFSALASVGSETMKIRVATPVRNWPMIAFARRSRSVRAVTRPTLPAPDSSGWRKIAGHERRDSPEARDASAQLGPVGTERRDRHPELHHARRRRGGLSARDGGQGVRARHSAPARRAAERDAPALQRD